MSWMFKLRGTLTKSQSTILGLIGIVVFLLIWFLVTYPFMSVDIENYAEENYPEIYKTELQPLLKKAVDEQERIKVLDSFADKQKWDKKNALFYRAILPSPQRVFKAYKPLFSDSNLVKNACYSIGLNLAGYVKAIVVSLLLGFIIGLFPLFRGLFSKHIDAIRFVPIAAVTGVFIQWFGNETSMKVTFLAFGIIIYLLPVIVQRIDEVKDVYLKTVYTIGASKWQTITSVYIPSVLSRLFDDLRILTAISWTYIIVVETIRSEGGIGSLIYNARRYGRIDHLFALIILIILIGVIQDQIFKYLDKEFFPHKYQIKNKHSADLEAPSLFDTAWDFGFMILVWILLVGYFVLLLAEFTNILGGSRPLTELFGGTLWVIHFIFISIVVYKIKKLYDHSNAKKIIAHVGV